MLDLEVVPERSLGNEQWEFALGECGVSPTTLLADPYFFPCPSHLWALPLTPLRPRHLDSLGLQSLDAGPDLAAYRSAGP